MRTLLLTIALSAIATPAPAQPQPPPRWTFGLLAVDRDAPYRGLDESLLFAPLVRFEGERTYLRGLRGGLRLYDTSGRVRPTATTPRIPPSWPAWPTAAPRSTSASPPPGK